ncbi:MAG: GDP-mannose 4,6-dehydratase [Candidatus Asgardarchaeia archaeon]
MKALITGGCGFIGSYLADRLLREGYEVLIVDNLSRGSVKRLEEFGIIDDVSFLKADLRYDLEKIIEFSKGVDHVFHLAAQVSVVRSIEDPYFDASNNILGTLNVLKLSKVLDAEKVIVYSSAAVFGDPIYVPIDEKHPKNPINPYGLSKLSSEMYASLLNKLDCVPAVVIRPFNVYGFGQNPEDPYAGVISAFIGRVLKGKPPVVYGGEQTRDFVNVKDLIDATILAVKVEDSVGEDFNIGSGKETSIMELSEIVMDAAGVDLDPIIKPMREGDIMRSVANIEKARKVLGYEPKVELSEGIKEILEKSSKS